MLPELYMKRCLDLAQKGVGYTAPNPMVGAVLVHNDRVIGEGWHHAYGEVHAEVDCLNSVAESDKALIPESTMYVSLEPCAHTGKTPPCAHRLVKEKVKKVVIANRDPFELVSGKGIEILQQAEIEVEIGMLEAEGAWLNRRFFTFHTQKRPYIILKWAKTKDGFIAPADRSRYQITNAHSQQLVHKWRTEEAAIMVGTTTAINDDPQLTARMWAGKQPLRIALDKTLKIPKSNRLYDNAADTWIINELSNEIVGNIRLVKMDFKESVLPQILSLLYEHKIMSLIVEGGAQLLDSFIAANLWDEARVFAGKTMLANGVAAPLLDNSAHAMTTFLDDDRLEVFVNNKNAYPYRKGMSL